VATQIYLRKAPHGQQQKFINATEPEQLYGGAKRGGKSVALCQKAILLSYFFPGNRGLLARKDFTDLQDTTLAEFWQVCPPELLDSTYGNSGHHKGERTIRLKTINPRITSDILYRGLGGPEDFEKAKSLTLGWFGLDEPSELAYEVYQQLFAQLTWQLPNGKRPPYMALLASNPEPGWVKDRFIQPVMDGHPIPGCIFIPSLPRQNPHLPEGWEIRLRESYDQEWIDKYLDGSWEVTEGSVFPELDTKLHAIDGVDHSGMRLCAAIDHATTGVTACLIIAIDTDNNLFALHEHYEKDHLVSWHAKKMKGLFDAYAPELTDDERKSGKIQQRFSYVLIDPSTQSRTHQGGNQLQSVIQLYNDEFRTLCGDSPRRIFAVPAWNALEAGLQRIKEYLHVKPMHIHPLAGVPGSPSIFIVKKRCPNLWKEMRDLKKEVLPSGQIRFVGIDHAVDCLRYVVNAQPKPAEVTPKDERHLPMQVQFARRAHTKWASKFGPTPGTNEWWSGVVN
jgi:hypothetical protein